MNEIFIKREIEKTKKHIEVNKYSKEDAIGFLKTKMADSCRFIHILPRGVRGINFNFEKILDFF